LINTFAQKIFSFEDGEYFDQVSAYRLLGGLATTFNEYAQQNAAAVHLDLDHRNENLNIILNCKNTTEILANPVAADVIELSVG
jgi:xanthine/CO dehydrogenase XdhC/CoxF family maturation factor